MSKLYIKYVLKKYVSLLCFLLCSIFYVNNTRAQHSVARLWNEAQLSTIRQDFARPPVQARNLFHVSVAMYDAWAVYDNVATTYVLDKTINGIYYPFNGIPVIPTALVDSYRNIAISYAAYRMLKHRYQNSANSAAAMLRFDNLMDSLGYSKTDTSTDYSSANPVAIGNYVAAQVIALGLNDGSREQFNYSNADYTASNGALPVDSVGALNYNDVTKWQPLRIVNAMDQNGNPIAATQVFLSPEWGRVVPFALTPTSCVHYFRGPFDYPVYYNPPAPPQLSLTDPTDSMSQLYKWGHSMVAIWSAHLDPNDTTLIDISPNAKGNNPMANYPAGFWNQKPFYKYINGGDSSSGYTVNPYTGLPYTPQLVKRGDFTRVTSQYWADGPTSETPPGHWYVILNEVSDRPEFVKRWEGSGDTLNNLEWDVKSYFAMGGAMHDAAIAAWGIKGWHDSPRPISAIRKMSQLGQSSNPLLPSYHPGGMPLVPGYIELIDSTDALAGSLFENVGRIKVKSWRGFSYIANASTDVAGVDWILGEKWMPYQRKTFVTPPFAGYISGHSTYSRAGAELMTKITGSEYFPGGLHSTLVPANSGFLVFESGPSTNISLQWAKYRDASDEASLSRIWGGIHPPFDDMNGRLIGEQIGIQSTVAARSFFYNSSLGTKISYFKSTENKCNVEINWCATDETEVKEYALYRSKDGLNYNTKLATFKPTADGNTKHYYNFTDDNPMEYNFYKLVSVDFSGKELRLANSYTSAQKCFNLAPIVISAIAPNPIIDDLKFSINSNDYDVPVQMKVVDALGKIVLQNALTLQYGANIFSFELPSIAKGVYWLTVTTDKGAVHSKKFQKI